MWDNRIEQLKIFLKEEPDDPFLKYSLALEYLKLDNDDEALSILEKLKTDSPEYLATYYLLGKHCEKLNKKEEAIEVYERGIIIAINQKNQRILRELKDALNTLLFED